MDERTESLISGGLDVTDEEVAYKDDSHGSGKIGVPIVTITTCSS